MTQPVQSAAAPALRARFPLHCRRVEDILAQL